MKLFDAIKAHQSVRFVAFYQKKFSSKEAYHYGEKSCALTAILILLILSILRKTFFLRHLYDVEYQKL